MYQLKNKNERLAIAGIAQTISGPVSEDLYKLIVKIDPKLADHFEKSEETKADTSHISIPDVGENV